MAAEHGGDQGRCPPLFAHSRGGGFPGEGGGLEFPSPRNRGTGKRAGRNSHAGGRSFWERRKVQEMGGGGAVVQNGWTGSRRREELRGQRLGQGEEEARKQSGQELRVHRIFSCQKKCTEPGKLSSVCFRPRGPRELGKFRVKFHMDLGKLRAPGTAQALTGSAQMAPRDSKPSTERPRADRLWDRGGATVSH